MRNVCKVTLEDLKYAFDKIDYWYKRNIKFLTIITVPFNTSCVFSKIISKISRNNGKTLYIWGKNGENRELVNSIREFNSDITHSYIEKGNSSTKLTFMHYTNLMKISQQYDLVIFDDITFFSNLSNANVRDMLEICANLGERVLLYSIEKTTLVGEKFELAAYNYKKPFVEPRILTTRIDLNSDIPFTLYDYLKWFRENRHKVAIYVPNREKLNIVYDYFCNKLKLSDVKIIKVSENDDIKRSEKVSKYKDKAIFIITNKIEELLEYCYIDDGVVLFSDNERYNYKKLLYICGQIRNVNPQLPEVLLVSNDVSEDMEKTKSMARNFNKKVWEKRLIEL
jgi:late competence protein required for DNA uptake (superfamily II DNA/RNA helicase)